MAAAAKIVKRRRTMYDTLFKEAEDFGKRKSNGPSRKRTQEQEQVVQPVRYASDLLDPELSQRTQSQQPIVTTSQLNLRDAIAEQLFPPSPKRRRSRTKVVRTPSPDPSDEDEEIQDNAIETSQRQQITSVEMPKCQVIVNRLTNTQIDRLMMTTNGELKPSISIPNSLSLISRVLFH